MHRDEPVSALGFSHTTFIIQWKSKKKKQLFLLLVWLLVMGEMTRWVAFRLVHQKKKISVTCSFLQNKRRDSTSVSGNTSELWYSEENIY